MNDGRNEMMWRITILCGALLPAVLGGGTTAWGQSSDRVIGIGASLAGTVVATSPNDVDVEDRNGDVKKMSIDKIREVQFGGEPTALRSARGLLLRGRGADALEELAKVEKSDIDGAEPLVVAEMQYVKSAGAARAALDSGEKVPEATALVEGFLSKNPTSHHTYEMQELRGDLLAQAGKVKEATDAYAAFAKGPPAFKVRAATAKARLYTSQKKYDEAIKEYDNALKIDADDEASETQKQAAMLGKARNLGLAGKHDDALGLVQKTIKQANPEAKELLAGAYSALGAIYRSMGGKDQDALISYLTVDLVYNTVPELHAEALYNLAQLWENGKQPERALKVRESLSRTYPASQWTKKLEAAAKSS